MIFDRTLEVCDLLINLIKLIIWSNWSFNRRTGSKLWTQQQPKLTVLTHLYVKWVKMVKFDKLIKFWTHARLKLTILIVLKRAWENWQISSFWQNLWPRVGRIFTRGLKTAENCDFEIFVLFFTCLSWKSSLFQFLLKSSKHEKAWNYLKNTPDPCPVRSING